MTFAVVAALAIALLVVAPLVAHLLRRGRVRVHEFPPAELVAAVEPAARHARAIEGRALLLIRVLVLVALAVLGATPLVRCSRLAVGRSDGASVAVAFVLDDSMSMQTRLPDGETRWASALEAADQLLDSMREGDALAIVLAGRPARLALGATTNLRAGRNALVELRPTDRATDLAGAMALAESALERLPHRDKRTAVLSDLAVAELPSPRPAIWAPLAALRQRAADCGVLRAERRGRRVSAEVVCNDGSAARGRRAELMTAPGAKAGDSLAGRGPVSAPLAAQSGIQTIAFETDSEADLDVALSGQDALPEDDRAPVASRPHSLTLAVVADPAKAAPVTGAVTVIEEALRALSNEAAIRPLATLPEDLEALERYGGVILDDPAGFAPEARLVLNRWLEKGGVAAAFLGPSSAQAALGSTLEPLLSGAVRWETTQAPGADPSTLGWLGAEAASLGDLALRGRLRFEGAIPAQSRIVGRWMDGIPMAVERRVGQGVWLAFGLPCSVDNSEFALRPGFLAVLSHVLELASRRNGARTTTAGTAWLFDAGSVIKVDGPRGELDVRTLASAEEQGTARRLVATAEDAGRYRVTVDQQTDERFVTRDPEELETQPMRAEGPLSRSLMAPSNEPVDASRTVAWLLVGLLGAELTLRGVGLWQARAARGAGRATERPSVQTP